jgi:hypothetical protein
MGDMHQGDAVLVRERMLREGEIALGGVVLKVHSGQVNAGPPAQQTGNFVNFLRALKDDGVNGVGVQRRQVHLPH